MRVSIKSSRELSISSPPCTRATPVTTSDRCYVSHLLVGSVAVQC